MASLNVSIRNALQWIISGKGINSVEHLQFLPSLKHHSYGFAAAGPGVKASGFVWNFILFLLVFLFILPFSSGAHQNTEGKIYSDSTDRPKLFQAIRENNIAEMERLLLNGANVNACMDGYSALMAAALNGSVEGMKMLIDHGANINYYNQDSLSAIWMAVPDWDKTRLLVEHGADLQFPSREGYTVMAKLATMPGNAVLLQYLIEKGAKPKKSSPDNFTLYNAVSSCDTAMVGIFLRSGLNANDSVSSGDYPINNALNYRCFDCVRMLVEHGANVNVKTAGQELPLLNGFTPLMLAALSEDRASFYYLLEHGADPSARMPSGCTVLMLLQQSESDQPEMTLALIKHGADPAARSNDGSDALYFAQKKGNTASVQILRKYLNPSNNSPK